MFELLTETAIADSQVLQANDEAGDNFSTPREVDFVFETSERQRADDFVEFVTGKSYGSARVEELSATQIRVLVLIHMPINQNILNSVSGFMLCLSRLFQIEYKGWGSVIQKS